MKTIQAKKKRERTIELRNKWIAGIQQITVSDKTIYHILAHLEEDYSDIERHLFLLMMDGENYQMRRGVYSVLQNSSTPIPLLNECKSGDVQIYDYTFRKEMKPMPYDNQDEFRKYVKDFLDEYGLQVVWFANSCKIMFRDILVRSLMEISIFQSLRELKFIER